MMTHNIDDRFFMDGQEYIIKSIDYDDEIWPYECYPVAAVEQQQGQDFDADFNDKYRKCLSEDTLNKLAATAARKISVFTPLGMLCAEVGGDASYPEIFIYLERPDGVQIDLTAVTSDTTGKTLKALLWADTGDEGYTNEHTWNADELNIAVN